MGYVPDPTMQVLAAYRNGIRPPSEQGTLGWLTNDSRSAFDDGYSFQRYVEGARARAAELGYRLEEFILRAPGMTSARMARILKTRGVVGLMVGPQREGRAYSRIRFEWDMFSAVTFGNSLAWPPLHVVANHQFDTVRLAYRKLVTWGYRRIGLCYDEKTNERADGAFLGGFLSESSRWHRRFRVEPFLYDSWHPSDARAWFRSRKPQAIIVSASTDIERFTSDLGLRTPEDVGMVCLTVTRKGFAFVDQNDRQIGAGAVDLVVSMIRNNERGIPPFRRKVLIEGTWHSGSSIRRIHSPPNDLRSLATFDK